MAKKKLTPEAFAAKVLTYRGTPFVLGGRIPSVGLDCCGVPLCALKELGWRPQHSDAVAQLNYPQVTEDDRLLKVIEGECVPVGVELQVGDILTFRWNGKEFPQHLGVVTRTIKDVLMIEHNNEIVSYQLIPVFVHAWNDPNIVPPRVVENTLRGEWLDRFHSAWRLRCFA